MEKAYVNYEMLIKTKQFVIRVSEGKKQWLRMSQIWGEIWTSDIMKTIGHVQIIFSKTCYNCLKPKAKREFLKLQEKKRKFYMYKELFPSIRLSIDISAYTQKIKRRKSNMLLFGHQVLSSSLRPHGLQDARPPCTSPSLGVCPSSCPLNQ